MKKTFLLTSEFPFQRGEAFISNEVLFLTKCQGGVTIISEGRLQGELAYKIPENSEAISQPVVLSRFHKFVALRGLLSTLFWGELIQVIKKLRVSPIVSMISTMLVSMERAAIKASALEKYMNSNGHQWHSSVFYSYWWDDSALAIALLKKRHPNMRAITRTHRWDLYFEESAIGYLPFRAFMLENLDGVYSISEEGKLYIENKYPDISKNKVFLSRLGVIKKYDTFAEKESRNNVIVSCSALIPRKRVSLLIDSLALLHQAVHWIHIGDGEQMDELRRKAEAHLTNKVTFEFKGQMQNDAIHQFYATNEVSLFINLSDSEGIPVSMMEAMCYGIPCIGTRVGGVAEIIEHGINGYLINENATADKVAIQISEYLQLDDPSRLLLSNNAYKTWEENYNAEKNYSEFFNIVLC